jgi:hypothetical protein
VTELFGSEHDLLKLSKYATYCAVFTPMLALFFIRDTIIADSLIQRNEDRQRDTQ